MNQERKNACWYNTKETPEKMLEGATGKLFPVLEKSDHWPVLRALLEKCEQTETLLDVGCGAGALSNLVDEKYTGCDLPHIIEKVSKVHSPNADLIPFDFYEDSLDFMNQYDIIVANAFIDVLSDPKESLEKLMKNAKDYVLIHRQRLSEEHTGSEKVGSYTGYSYSSILSVSDLKQLCKEYKFEIQYIMPWSKNSYSFLMKKH